MKNRTTSDIRTALKGRHISAQGSVLGQEIAELPETPALMEKE